jgi:hypothetical protein
MLKRASRTPEECPRRWRPTASGAIACTALFIALGGSAFAANGLIRADEIAPGAVTTRAIRHGAVEPRDLSSGTKALIGRTHGAVGATGNVGSTGPAGTPGASGVNGANGPNGANGTNGVDGTNGANGAKGEPGTDGTNGTNGTIAPLSATQGLVALPTSTSPTTVVQLNVPAGKYVVFAKTEISQTGAGDSVECLLKSGAAIVDQAGMKTMPALAAVPATLQAVITATTSPTPLSLQCTVAVANGSANFNSLIAIPTA